MITDFFLVKISIDITETKKPWKFETNSSSFLGSGISKFSREGTIKQTKEKDHLHGARFLNFTPLNNNRYHFCQRIQAL